MKFIDVQRLNLKEKTFFSTKFSEFFRDLTR